MNAKFLGYLGAFVLGVPAMGAEGEGSRVTELSAFPVYAGSLETGWFLDSGQLAERMERDVRVDLQSRGGTRYQTDISVRGGIFEATGLMVGGLALFDPQTGHYFSEIPLSPVFFSGARLLTGVRNGLEGFNTTAGTIDWEWAAIEPGGGVRLTVGGDRLRGFGGDLAGRSRLSGGDRLSWQADVLREAGDGSLAGGDFDLKRVSGRLEWETGAGRLRVFGGYVDKFYGWPGMYTGFSSLKETDDYQVSLLGWQWEQGGGLERHRIGGTWRRLDDDYEFNREAPGNAFEHRTEVFSLQGDGRWQSGKSEFSYRWIWVRDRIRRSTSLVNGAFDERDYGELAILGERRLDRVAGSPSIYGGLGLETTSEDATVLSPMGGLKAGGTGRWGSWEAYLEYARTSQVPGYTVLNSPPTGLFGGNPDLGRETADSLEAGWSVEREGLTGKLVIFHRRDRDLVDWVFERASPSARQAAAVDIEVNGVEAWLHWEGAGMVVEMGYAFLDKEPDWKGAGGDASFYALNFARHRVLASAAWTFSERARFRLEGEFRDHAPNLLRNGRDSVVKLNAFLGWEDFPARGWAFQAGVRNLTDAAFEHLPGTPGPRRSWEVTLIRNW
jgi:hypothetical protein